MNYLKELKLAVINKDMEKLKELSKKDISFSSIKEAKEINSYIKLAVKMLEKEKAKVFSEMEKIKKLQKFNLSNKDSFFNLKG